VLPDSAAAIPNEEPENGPSSTLQLLDESSAHATEDLELEPERTKTSQLVKTPLNLTMPNFSMPKLPSVTLPSIKLPNITMPNIKLPNLKLPTFPSLPPMPLVSNANVTWTNFVMLIQQLIDIQVNQTMASFNAIKDFSTLTMNPVKPRTETDATEVVEPEQLSAATKYWLDSKSSNALDAPQPGSVHRSTEEDVGTETKCHDHAESAQQETQPVAVVQEMPPPAVTTPRPWPQTYHMSDVYMQRFAFGVPAPYFYSGFAPQAYRAQ